ncbi:MAG: hypothetical protein E7006_00530 [Alphaproteobacteria bacterium]|nr:hypothetical protein [Alphaproteobacteria bacterium]
MKKIFAIFLGLFIYTNSAWALYDIGDLTPNPGGGLIEELQCVPLGMCPGATRSVGCNAGSDYCNNCSGYSTSTSTPKTGVTATTSYKKAVNCIGVVQSCVCSQTTTYACASGYCGTCTDETDLSTCNCKAIPANGYCSAGEIKCNTGYYNTNPLNNPLLITSCTACPANSESCTNLLNVTCKKNYYAVSGSANTICNACPDNTVTASTGATSVAQCYIPAGTTFSDTSGNGKYVTDCYSD